MIPKRIIVLGGSTVYGEGDPETGGFVSRLRSWHESKNLESHRVFNLGVGGDSVADLLQRGPAEARVRRPDLILLYPGLNDMRRLGSRENPTQSTPESVLGLLSALIAELKQLSPVALMSAVPPDESRTSPFSGRWFFSRVDAEAMSKIISEVASRAEVPYLPLFERWKNKAYLNGLLADGLHCNTLGHESLCEEVKNFLIANFKSP